MPPTAILTAFCPDIEDARKAFEALERSGIRAAEVCVLARGLAVDKHLVVASERNANPLAPMKASAPATGLGRKLSGENRFLLEGCWAVGPIFEKLADRSGIQGAETLAKTLLRAGLGMKEVAAVEAALRNRGGVWLAVKGEGGELARAEEALRSVGNVEVNRFPPP